jgi:hypothetical protein
VVGFKLPELGAAVLPVARGDALVLATDGIRGDFADGLSLIHPPQQVADQILARHAKRTDDALALVAVFLGEAA